MNPRGAHDPSALPCRIRDERRVRAILLAVSAALAVALAEASLRFLVPEPTGHFIHRPHLIRTFHPLPGVMPGVEGESEFRVNSLGVRGGEPLAGKRRLILALGGSSTECLYLDQEEAWPALLEKELNSQSPSATVWVGNAGKSGVSSREHRLQIPILLEDLPRIDTLILLPGFNDLLLRLALTDKYDPDFVVKPGSRDFLVKRAFDIVPSATDSPRVPLFPRRTVGLTLNLIGGLFGIEQAIVPTHLVEDRAGATYVQRRLHRRNRIGTLETLPDLSTGLREFEKNLSDCLRAARSQGTQVLLVSQPVLWQENLPEPLEDLLWTGGVGSISGEGIEYYSTAVLAEGMQRYNDRLRSLAEAESAGFFDLAAHLPRDDSVFYDDCHFNESGCRRVAALIAETLRSPDSNQNGTAP